MKTITLHYSEALIRKAVLAFWLRATGWQFFGAGGLLLVAFVALLAAGDRSWFVGVTGAVLALAVIFAAALYLVHYRTSLMRFRRMTHPHATLEMNAETFRVTSDVGTSEMAWRTITQIWRFPEFWLVFLSPAQFLTLPLTDLDAESRDFLLEKVRPYQVPVK